MKTQRKHVATDLETARQRHRSVYSQPAQALYEQGHALMSQGRFNEAADCFQQAIALEPDYAEVHSELGIAFARQGKPDQAVDCFRQAVALRPDFAEAHSHLGSTLKMQGKLEEAAASYRNAIALKPDFAEAHGLLGSVLREQRKLDEAVAAYQRALALRPNFAEAYNDLGLVFAHQGKQDEAAACYRKALALKPDFAAAYSNQAVALQAQGKPDDAIACYRKALAYKPEDAYAHSNLLLSMQYSSSTNPEELFAEHVRFGTQFETPIKPHWLAHSNARDPHKRLKIGYVSPDLHKHPVADSIEPVLAQHDKSQVEVFCYYSGNGNDAVTARLQTLADHWLACKHLSDEQLAQHIRADGIDILVDLAGHTGGNRLLVFARKPAPVQITYLGYPATTGLSAIDYRFTDAYAEPPGMTEQFNVEQLWRLPGSFCCYRPHDSSIAVIGHPPAEDNGYVTFGSFNNFSKVTDPVIALWARVLQQVPNARLLLEIQHIDNLPYRAEVESRFARLGLPLERLILEPRKKENQYVLYNRIDIGLDPFPCNGGTTSLDAVWMGVPFVTLAGRHFTSRLGVTILSNAGLPELVAQTEDEYVSIAAGLAQDLPRLKAMRAGLRERVQAGPLMDARRFASNIEQAYRAMWHKWFDSVEGQALPDIANPAVENQRSHVTPDIEIALQHHRAGRLQQAEAIYKEMPDNPDALHLRGIILHQLNKNDEAVELISQAIHIHPANAAYYFSIDPVYRALNRLNDVVQAYQRLLVHLPDNADAHNNLGNALKDQGKSDEALASYRKALACDSCYAVAHCNMGIALKEQGKPDEAVACYRNALALKPDFAEAHNNLGLAYADQGKPDEAIDCYWRALALKPDFAVAHINLGIAFHAQGKLDDAAACYQSALTLAPGIIEAHNNLGNIFKEQGKLDNATACYQKAVALQPDNPALQINLGNGLRAQHKLDEAVRCYLNAITLRPDSAEAFNNLGLTLTGLGKPDEAIGCYQTALALSPDYAEAYNNLGIALKDQGKPDDALECYQKAVALKPDFAEAYNNLGIELKEHGRLGEAMACFQKAVALKTDFADAHTNMGIAYKEQGRLDDAVVCYRNALACNPHHANAHHSLLLAMQYSTTPTPEETFAEHVRFGVQFETPFKPHWLAYSNARDPHKRLKIGYVSPDFHKHPVADSIEPVLAQHDKSQVEVFCYYSGNGNDAVTARLQMLADHWLACKHLSDEQLAQHIRADGIDILVDLAGHTGGNRLLTFARKPAPVQITYLGYPATTGLSAIDYRFTDAYAEPPGMTEQFNVEQLWRLPGSFCCYRPHDGSIAVIGHPPAEDNGYVTFGSFNNFSKVTDPVIALWARVLQQVPNARLLLEIQHIDNPAYRAEVEGRFARLGLPLERLILEPRKKENQYVLYNRIDIGLDPFPCNGGTTSLDTVWMGVPFVTLAGRHFTSRLGVTILNNAGLPELVAQTEDEYVAIAAGLAQDLPRLKAVRAGLRERVQTGPLMDARRFASNIEQAYRAMWHKWCGSQAAEGTPPESAIAHTERGTAFLEQGRLDEAIACFHQALAIDPNNAAAHNNLGNALGRQGKLDEAVASYSNALAINPSDALAHYNLGGVLKVQGRPDDAAACYRNALAAAPEFAEAYNNLGLVLQDLGKPGDAIACYRHALALKPDFAGVHNNLGTALKDQGKLDEAIACYLNALALKTDFVDVHNNLGLAFAAQGNTDEAVKCYQTALAMKPDHAEAHNNLGAALHAQGKLEDAVACYRTAVKLQPDHVRAHLNLGVTLYLQGCTDEAIASYRKALTLAPGDAEMHSNFLLAMLGSAAHSPDEVFAAHAQFAAKFETALKRHWSAHPNARDPHKRLKIGYVSPDFRDHAVSYFIEPVLASHDKSQVEVFCYYNHQHHDEVTRRLQALADHWLPCHGMPDEQLAERIRADGIDLLIDLAGHTAGNRLLTFARKPAPVQIAYLGYPFSTGLSAFDYRITDAQAEPPGMTEQFNSESLWRLPHAFFCYGKPQNSPAITGHPPSEDNGYVTFGCLNNFAKVNDRVIALWARILHKVPSARLSLVIKGIEDTRLRAEVEQRFARQGVEAARLILMPPVKENHFALYHAIDIALDPFPFNGHTTSLDTLWMGVPFVTLAGRHYTSRMGASTLVHAGLPELVAQTEDEYVEIAAGLALDAARLKRMRSGLRERLHSGPLMDAQRFTQELEQAYRNMWHNWCSGEHHHLASEQMPDDPITCNDQGNAARNQGDLDQAKACYRKAIALDPGYAIAYSNLASVFTAQGNFDDALACHHKAISLDPDFAEGHCNLAIALLAQCRFAEAVASCMKAIALKPDFAEAFQCLGNIFEKQDNSEEAIRCYETAIALKPDYAEAHYNQGVMFHAQGRPDEAIACYRRALAIQPENVRTYNNLLFAILYSDGYTPADIFAEHRHFAQQFEAPLIPGWHNHPNARNPHKRLKIGYVSPDFRNHPVAAFIEPVLASHDKSQVEVFCYYNHQHHDEVTRRLQALADHWLPCCSMPDEQLAERIRADGIDLLIDLAGHTGIDRLLTFARKPAPVQIAYLGYPFSTGLSAFDYRITDALAEPPGMTEQFNSESLWRLPHAFFCYGKPQNSPAITGHPPSEDNGYVTFGCFNNFAKVNDRVIALWARILDKVPSARLSLVVKGIEDTRLRAEVEQRFARQGVEAARLILMPPVKDNHFALYHAIDIALDPFPFNGHTTSLDTLWMGVPFVTLAGRHYTSRMGASTLVHAGLPELVAQTEDEYVEIAAGLALDATRLKRTRTGVRERLQAGPLMDAQRFTWELEQAYRSMWHNWCHNPQNNNGRSA